MKRYLSLVLFLFAVACQKSPLDEIQMNGSSSSKSFSDDLIYKIDSASVSNYLSMFYPKVCVKSINTIEIDDGNEVYAVNIEKGGWMIMSNDIRLTPLLAYSAEGNVSIKESMNYGFLLWIKSVYDMLLDEGYLSSEECKSNILHWQRSFIKTNDTLKSMAVPGEIWVKRLMSHRVDSTGYLRGPLTMTRWGQGSPWNSKLPYNFYTGCAAVALSQILFFNNHFYNIPNGLYHNVTVNPIDVCDVSGEVIYRKISVQRTGYTPYSIRWGEMKLESIGSGNAAYVADLMADVGERVDTKYYPNGSYTTVSCVYNALSSYSLQGEISGYSYNTVKLEIDNNRVVFMLGVRHDSESGHSWVLDGYRESDVTHTYEYVWLVDGNQYEGELYTREQVQSIFPGERLEDGMLSYEYETFRTNYVHMNWGWDGELNGFYLSTPGIDYPYGSQVTLIKGIRAQNE